MLKTILLSSCMIIAMPILAQEAKPAENTATQDKAASATPEVATDDAAPATAADQTNATPQATPTPQPTPQAAPATGTTPSTAPAQPAPAAKPAAAAATPDQVAVAVSRDWNTYDKDANGQLSAVEFGMWMTSLRKKAEPGFTPGTAEATAWEAQAFTAADADKSASVTKQELTTFLTPKPS